MDILTYKSIEDGLCPMDDLLTLINKKERDELRVKSHMRHVFVDGNFPNSQHVGLAEAGKCHDGKSVHYLKVKLSEKRLLRIFLVSLNGNFFLGDWLIKRHNPDYSAREKSEVDKDYEEKIENTIKYYKEYCEDNNNSNIITI